MPLCHDIDFRIYSDFISEFISKCRRGRKYLLSTLKDAGTNNLKTKNGRTRDVKLKNVSVGLVHILSKGRKSKMIHLPPRAVLTRIKQENKKGGIK